MARGTHLGPGSFRKIFGARNIDVRVDTITEVDFKGKEARSATATYPFDYIIVGVGAEPEYFGIPGVQENSFPLWSFDDAMRIRHHLEDIFTPAARETDPAKRKSLCTFVVAGAGFTGMEMIGELLEYRQVYVQKASSRSQGDAGHQHRGHALHPSHSGRGPCA